MGSLSLKDSDRKEALQALHAEIWGLLQEEDEDFSEQYLIGCLRQLKGKHEIKQSIHFRHFYKKRELGIALLIGLLIVPVFFYFFIWYALRIE